MKSRQFKRALITGITGSGGSYLAEYIIKNNPRVVVHGMSRWHSTASADNLHAVQEKVVVHECDLNDFSSVFSVLNEVKPDLIFHLASHANVRASFITPLAVLENNIMGTANLFEAVRAAGIDPTIVVCSTSEVYGQVSKENVPIREDCPIAPVNPYAVSKAAQDFLAGAYFKSYGMKMIRTRMFAYLNPRRGDLFATSFARQVALIEQGKRKELTHGNLDSVRTIIDVRDAMEAYWLTAQKGVYGDVYNIGGTTVITVGEFLALLKKHARCPIKSRVDKTLLRPTDVTLQIPDVSKFITATGWKPRHSFEESVAHLLEHCRA